MRLLLAADVFPPRCGGAGWSSYHLARGLQQAGHDVLVVVPRERAALRGETAVGGVPVREFPYRAPRLPFLRNLFRNELLWPRLGRFLARLVQEERLDLIHAQHSLTAPAALYARGVPVVVTVRDYWPLCYRATLLDAEGNPCTRCDLAAAVRCLGRPLGPFAPLVALLYPYIRGNLRRKARALAQADAVIAVSRAVAGRLAPLLPPERLHVLPNAVDLEEVDQVRAQEPATPLPGPFLLFVGKVEGNKGVRELVAALERATASLVPEARLPLLVAGDGSLSPWAERELARIGWPAHFLRWADHDEVLRLLSRCHLLLFPSRWEEPLSRVLLEACACGAPILAMATGGTAEILRDGENGALVPPAAEPFAERLLALLADPAERQRLGQAARRTAEEHFATPVVIRRVEQLYHKRKQDNLRGAGFIRRSRGRDMG